MVNDLNIRMASIRDLDEIACIFMSAIKVMEDNSIYQWDEVYPDKEILQEDILKGQMYIGDIDGIAAVAFVLNQEFESDYKNGDWKYRDSSFYVIHRLCVNPLLQNRGIGTKTMVLIEEILKKKDIGSVRLDVFSLNPYAVKMYEKMGYARVGEAVWRKGLFYLMEKKISS